MEINWKNKEGKWKGREGIEEREGKEGERKRGKGRGGTRVHHRVSRQIELPDSQVKYTGNAVSMVPRLLVYFVFFLLINMF